MWGNAFRNTVAGPGLPQVPSQGQLPWGQQGPQTMFPVGGGAPQMVGGAPEQGGGWLGGIRKALGGLGGMEALYLGAGAAGGVMDWWEQKKQRELIEREMDEEKQRRSNVGASLNRAWGGG